MTQGKRPNTLLYFVILLLFLTVLARVLQPRRPQPSYAEVKALFEREKVKSFTIADTTLTLVLREEYDGRTTVTKDIYDFDLFYDDLTCTFVQVLDLH